MKKNNSLLNSNFLNMVPLVCSLMVVMIHQHLVSGDAHTISSRIISFFTHGICTAAVPTFFLLSGYLFFRNAESVSDIVQKQKKRIKSLLMPFLAWSAFYYGLFAVVSIVMPGFLQSNVNLTPVGILKGIFFYEYAFPLWYMFQLCVFVLLSPVILLILRSKIASVIVLVAAAAMGVIGLAWSIDVGGYERAIFQTNFFAYYLLGCLLSRLPNVQEALIRLARKIPYTVLTAALLMGGLLESVIFDEIIPCFNNRLAVPLVFAAFFLLMVKLCHRDAAYAAPKVSTMVIYGVHSAVGIIVMQFVLARFALPAIAQFSISFLLVAALSAAAAWIMRFIKPIHWIFSGDR